MGHCQVKAVPLSRILVLALALLGLTPASKACEDDADCKGDRICNSDGRCANPDSDKQPRERPQQSYDNYRSPQPQIVARFCVTNVGSCTMAVRIPVGSSCFCPTPYGPISGIAQ